LLRKTDWKLVFEFKQAERQWCHEFYNVSTLSNYFKSVPERGMLVGYGEVMPVHRRRQTILPCSDGRLSIWFLQYNMEYSYDFSDVYDFANFLKQHPPVAKAVGYKAN